MKTTAVLLTAVPASGWTGSVPWTARHTAADDESSFAQGGEVSIVHREDYPAAQVLREAADLLERTGRVERLNVARRPDAPDDGPPTLRVIDGGKVAFPE